MNAADRLKPALARRLFPAVLIVALLGGLTQSVQARPRIQPYVSLTLSADTLDLGNVAQPGVFDSPAILTVHIAANCSHGGIVISTTPLAGPGGAEIPLARFSVKLPATGQFVPMIHPVVLTGPMNPGVVDVPVMFRVETQMQTSPGKYTGTITFTVGP